MYLNVNTSVFKDIPSVPALLSLSEMLYQKKPEISSVFANYAAKLVQNQLARTGSSPERDAAFASLQGIAQQMKLPPQKVVENFANSLVASANGQFANEFNQIAYLAYCSLSLYGNLTNSVQLRLANVQNKISSSLGQPQVGGGGPPQFDPTYYSGAPKFTPYNGAPPSFNPTSSGGPPQFTPQGGPPSFNPTSSGGPPVFTPQGGPPSFTPQGGPPRFTQTTSPPAFTPQGGPPVFTPQGPPSFNGSPSGPPVFTPPGAPPAFTPAGGPPSFTPQGGHPQFNPSTSQPSSSNTIPDKARRLMELANSAFKAGALAVAYTALNGAINELQK